MDKFAEDWQMRLKNPTMSKSQKFSRQSWKRKMWSVRLNISQKNPKSVAFY